MFRRRWLDQLTRVHPLTPYAIGLPLAAFAVYRASSEYAYSEIALLAAAGWLLWTLLEYLMHRCLFHMPGEHESLRIALLLAHGHHHVWPNDPRRIAATLVQLLSLLLLIYGLLALLLSPATSWAVFGGVLLGYTAYEAVHWMAHHGQPRIPILRALKKHHLRHHLEPGSRWGISSPLWDWVFATC